MIGTVEESIWTVQASEGPDAPVIGSQTMTRSAKFAYVSEARKWMDAQQEEGFIVRHMSSMSASYFGPTDSYGNCWHAEVFKALLPQRQPGASLNYDPALGYKNESDEPTIAGLAQLGITDELSAAHNTIAQQCGDDYDANSAENAPEPAEEPEVDWYFTFTGRSIFSDRYIMFHGTESATRLIMNNTFSDNWGFQYSEAQKADSIDRYDLMPIEYFCPHADVSYHASGGECQTCGLTVTHY